MVSQLDQNYSSSRVGSNFVAGFKNRFSVPTRVVLFGVLRFLSSMRSVVSGSLQIKTVFHAMLQHRTIRYFPAGCLQMKANKLFLVAIDVLFGLNIRRINIDMLSCSQRFYSKKVVVL